MKRGIAVNKLFATIPVRRVHFNFRKNTSKHWIKGSPFKTHLLNSFSIIFPEGEKYFIRSVGRYIKHIKNPQLKANARAFLQQEAQHCHQHERFLEIMREQGYKIDHLLKVVSFLNLKVFEKHFPSMLNLSITAGLEHYTALLSDICLSDDFLKEAEEELRALFEWHAAEEIEHKAVAFDVLCSQNESYALRIAGLGLATIFLASYTGVCTASLLKQDKLLLSPTVLREIIEVGFTKQKLLPKVMINFLRYFDPNFHPDQMGNDEFAQTFLESFGFQSAQPAG